MPPSAQEDRRSRLEARVEQYIIETAKPLAHQIVVAMLQDLRQELSSFRTIFEEIEEDPAKSKGPSTPSQGMRRSPTASAKSAARPPAAQRIRTCVAPNCSNASRGPRFGYTCKLPAHDRASKDQKATWRGDYLAKEAVTEASALSRAEQMILEIIANAKGGATPVELRDALEMDGPKLSYHMNHLKTLKLVRTEGSTASVRYFPA